MTLSIKPPAVAPDIIPESAPFSTEQRQWLNGFFAGMLALDTAGATALPADAGAAIVAGEDDSAPWHDPAMELAERMKLAEGRPLKRRMFTAPSSYGATGRDSLHQAACRCP